MKKRVKGNVLAEGEVTGHYHAATAGDAEVWDSGDGVELSAPNGSEIEHQEHRTISVPPGEYDRTIVREYDPFEEAAREVAD